MTAYFGFVGFVLALAAFGTAGNCRNRIKKLEEKLKELEVLSESYEGE